MLPYTPLHHLIAADFRAAAHDGRETLVVTSGNISDEPIAFEDEDALVRLAPLADLFLLHDREIETRTDDSVARTVRITGRDHRQTIRRSRGYVPGHVPLPVAASRPILACGAQQKNTFCVVKDTRAWVGHHIGDLDHYPTLLAFRAGIAHFERLFAVVPEVVAHDLHPDYLSTAYALERQEVELVGVQHHHAHLAACLAEHGLSAETKAVGAIFDGTGYGLDGTIWGGELLAGGLTEFERAGWLWPVRMPGGAAAIRQPWRMAFAWLSAAFGAPQPAPRPLRDRIDPARWQAMRQIGDTAAVSPVTSSIGRLFDAVAALCGFAAQASYEGQAAVELEAAAWTAPRAGAYQFEFRSGRLDPRAAVREIVADLEREVGPGTVAARFHAGLAAATASGLTSIASARGIETAVLSGGVFQNRLLLEMVASELERKGLRVLMPQRLPPNDGGISFGQAAVAAAQAASG
jgi:hydrogenase maturation protein HypF